MATEGPGKGKVLKAPTRPPKGQRKPKAEGAPETTADAVASQPPIAAETQQVVAQSQHLAATAAPPVYAPPPRRAAAAPAPARARPREARPPSGSRRKFLADAFSIPAWLSFTIGAVGLAGLVQRFLFPNVLYEPPTTFKAGFPNDYAVNEFSQKFKDLYRVWIVREATGFYAIYAKCTHLGCTPNWMETEDKIKCPCHGSGYYRSGINFEGPTPRPLERVKITMSQDGQLLVDTSVHYRYELGQWELPGSKLNYS